MRKIILIAIVLTLVGCGTNQPTDNNNLDVIKVVLDDFSNIEHIDESNGIALFASYAFKDANEQISISDGNIDDVLAEAKNYKHCFIVVEDHTIVKIINLEDCKQSGSWGVCMPYVEGYIKKGDYDHQEDYMNNIIGLPDNQERTAYLFN